MKKSIFSAGLMVLAALFLIAPTRVEEGGSPTPAPTASSSGAVVGTVVDSGGSVIALVTGDVLPSLDSVTDVPNLRVRPSTVPVPAGPPWLSTTLGNFMDKVTDSGKYFPVLAFPNDPSAVSVTVPASTPVAFCSGGAYYNRGTGQCSDGKFPYKIVPLNSLSDPAAQNATVTCSAPTVPTWNPAQKKWTCIVPTGFKSNL